MKIELRKVTYNARLSEETSAYAAQVWADDVHVCDVSNHGTGGADEQHPVKGKTSADVEALNDYCKKNFPVMVCNFNDETGKPATIEHDLEMHCGDLLNEWLVAKDLKKQLSKRVLWSEGGKIWNCKIPTGPADQVERWKGLVRQKHGVTIFLNEMPFEEALQIFRKAA